MGKRILESSMDIVMTAIVASTMFVTFAGTLMGYPSVQEMWRAAT